MSARDELNKIVSSGISYAMCDGVLVGYRIKLYDSGAGGFSYYDVPADCLSGKDKDFFKSLPQGYVGTVLLKHVNGRLASDDELSGLVSPKEVTSKDFIIGVIAKIKDIYSYRKGRS